MSFFNQFKVSKEKNRKENNSHNKYKSESDIMTKVLNKTKELLATTKKEGRKREIRARVMWRKRQQEKR